MSTPSSAGNWPEFSKAFRDFYKQKKFGSAFELSQFSGLDNPHLTKMKNNPILNPTEKTIEKLAKAFAKRNNTNVETEKKEIQQFFQEWRNKKSSTGNNSPMNQVQSWSLNLEVTTNDLSEFKENILPDIMAQLENVGEGMIIVKYAKKGSIILGLESSSESYLKIRNSYLNGELSELLGFTVSDLQIQPSLTQWFQGMFTQGWESAAELLTPQQLAPAFFAEEAKRAKQINLQVDLITHSVILLMNISRRNEAEITINLQVLSAIESNNLPPNLKLKVLSEGEIFGEVTARSNDRFIQYEFAAEQGDEFTIALQLGEALVTEDFVV